MRDHGCARRSVLISTLSTRAAGVRLICSGVHGKVVAGFAAFDNHLSYLPTAARASTNSASNWAVHDDQRLVALR